MSNFAAEWTSDGQRFAVSESGQLWRHVSGSWAMLAGAPIAKFIIDAIRRPAPQVQRFRVILEVSPPERVIHEKIIHATSFDEAIAFAKELVADEQGILHTNRFTLIEAQILPHNT